MTRLTSQVVVNHATAGTYVMIDEANKASAAIIEAGAVGKPARIIIELEERTIIRVLGATKFNEHRAIQDGLARRYETETT